jgi:hypothetical protein
VALGRFASRDSASIVARFKFKFKLRVIVVGRTTTTCGVGAITRLRFDTGWAAVLASFTAN